MRLSVKTLLAFVQSASPDGVFIHCELASCGQRATFCTSSLTELSDMPKKPDSTTDYTLPAGRGDLAASLLAWYDTNHRPLPWREQSSLYRTVVSEFMLQQTQVKTMLPYFDRWMATLPDFESLAQAEETTVIKLWEGLGYYRRVRYLRQLAQAWCAADPKPTSSRDWQALPGVGPYMAAAIASITFQESTAVVDGNVVRVVARLLGMDDAFSSPAAAIKQVRPFAQQILDPLRPGDCNQAFMELGATVCRPQSPTCLLCPWVHSCRAARDGHIEKIPDIHKAKTERRVFPRLLVIDSDKQLILLQEGGMDGRLEGLYELPLICGEVPADWKPLATIRRGISNQIIQEPIFAADLHEYHAFVHKKTEPEWIPLKNLDQVPLSGPHRKWLSGFPASSAGSC
jgi:A/G-specific adenine glycosylase